MTDSLRSIPTSTLAAWLTGRSDDELAELLRRRPDLTVPLPASMAVLAHRAEQRGSVVRIAEDFNTVELVVIETLLHATEPPSRSQLLELLPGSESAIESLRSCAVVWGDDELHVVPAATAALPWPALRDPDDDLPEQQDDDPTFEEITAALATLTDTERALIDRLARTAPIGRTRDAAPGTPADRPVQRLLTCRLLRWLDDQTVELPATVGRVLRSENTVDPRALTPPELNPTPRSLTDVDGAAAGEALELLRHCTDIITLLGDVPAPALRAGGMRVRDLRRLVKYTGLSEDRVGLLIELLVGAGLVASGHPSPEPVFEGADDFWAPTAHVDGWLDAEPGWRWAVLATAWLELARRPDLIGLRNAEDKPIAALSDELRSIYAPIDRRTVLTLLAELKPGHSAEPGDLAAVLAWRRPRQAGRFRADTIARMLADATTLGIVGRGALSSPGRAALNDDDEVAAMEAALPTPVDYVLVQADLTVVAPGLLTSTLQQRIAGVADLESAGGAAVYRVSEASVRRAMDAGTTAAELHALFAKHSRTPVPQALTYLIDDVARRHGRLRVGVASSFVRCEDPAQLAEMLASPVAEMLALRAIAPTVAIAQAPLAEVLAQLRESGFSPAGENAHGSLIDLAHTHGARIVGRPRRPLRPHLPTPPTPDQVALLITELRANDRAASSHGTVEARGDGSRTAGAAALALLQLAVRVRRDVSISYVNAQGSASHRIVEPLKIGGGQLDAIDKATGILRQYTLHRIAAVTLVD